MIWPCRIKHCTERHVLTYICTDKSGKTHESQLFSGPAIFFFFFYQLFTEWALLGQFSQWVAMSVCHLSVCLDVCLRPEVTWSVLGLLPAPQPSDTWHLTHKVWHLSPDIQTFVGGEHFLKQVLSSYGLGVKVFWRFGGKGLMNEWTMEVFVEQPGTLGLLNALHCFVAVINIFVFLVSQEVLSPAHSFKNLCH